MIEKNIRLLWVISIALWPVVTYASGESLGQTLGAIKAADWLAVIALSGISGAVALLQRVRKSIEAKALEAAGHAFDASHKLLVDMRFYALCHMAASFVVGFIAFLLCEHHDVNAHMEALMIAGCAWGGAKIADKWGDDLAERASNLFATSKQTQG